MRLNRFLSGFILALPLALATMLIACGDDAADADGEGDAAGESEMSIGGPDGDPIARGKFLVEVMGCDDCHSVKKMTPMGPQPDPEFRMAGHLADRPLPDHDPSIVGPEPDKWILANNDFTAYVGPWGTSYAANLTPDPTGIGEWSEEQFIRALQQGKYKGLEAGRMLMPPMPWQSYGKLQDADIKAIFAYLNSLPPISNTVPAAEPSPLWEQMMAGGPPGAGGPSEGGAPPEGGAVDEAGDDAAQADAEGGDDAADSDGDASSE